MAENRQNPLLFYTLSSSGLRYRDVIIWELESELGTIVRLMQHFFPGYKQCNLSHMALVSVQISSYNHRPI